MKLLIEINTNNEEQLKKDIEHGYSILESLSEPEEDTSDTDAPLEIKEDEFEEDNFEEDEAQ